MTNPQSEDRAAALRQRYGVKPQAATPKPPTTPSIPVGPEPTRTTVPPEWDDDPAPRTPRGAAPVNIHDPEDMGQRGGSRHASASRNPAPQRSVPSRSTSRTRYETEERPSPQTSGGHTRSSYEDDMDFSTVSGSSHGESDYIVSARHEKPQRGVRKFLANTLHLPVRKGKAEVEWDSWISHISRSLLEPKVIGVIGGKGGVGKTTSAMTLASIIAKYRAKPVCLITFDHNHTLSLRTKTVTDAARGAQSLVDFVSDPDIVRVSPERAARVARYMKSNPERLNVMGTGIDVLHRQALSAQDYLTAIDILKGVYEVIVVDFGPPSTDAYWAALESLDALVMVTSAENDSMRGVAQVETYVRESGLTSLIDHGTIDLVCRRNSAAPKVNLKSYVHQAHTKHRDVLEIPYDEHLSEGGPISLDLLNPRTVHQYTVAAKLVMDRV